MEKIKSFLEGEKGRNLLIILIVVLVGTASFELGRLSKGGVGRGITIEYPDGTLSEITANLNEANALTATESLSPTFTNSSKSVTGKAPTPTAPNPHAFFASKRGKKYYPAGCSAGKSLKMENRIYFATRAEAEAAGYTLSVSCK